MKKSMRNCLFVVVALGGLTLSACSTQGASRYGDVQSGQTATPCGTVMVPCGHVVEYHRVQVQQPAYLVPAPCPVGQCPPVVEPPLVLEPPVIVEPPIVAEPPVIAQPPIVVEPPVLRPPIVDDPVISCPEGTIPAYGGQDCIPITVPRK